MHVSGLSLAYTLDPAFASALFDEVKADPDRVIEERGRVLKHDRTTTVALVENAGHRWIIKRYNTKNLWHALRRTVRRSRAANSWTMSRAFRSAGIATADPVAFIERRFGPLRMRSYFVSVFVEAGDLQTLVSAAGGGSSGDIERAKRHVIALFRTLRAARLNHGDMKATNILVAGGGLVLIDFDAAAEPATAEAFERGYRKDRARFLKNWSAHPALYECFDRELPE